MHPSCDVVHTVPPSNFGAFVNSATSMPQRNKCNKTLCQLFLWSYLIPGLLIYTVFYTLDLKLSTVAPFLYSYFILATIFNFWMLRKILDSEQATRDSEPIDAEAPPTGTPTDSPPAYWEAVKDPPSYSFLQYYRRMMSRKSGIRRNNSLEKRNQPGSPTGSHPPSSKSGRNPKLNRNFSCPN